MTQDRHAHVEPEIAEVLAQSPMDLGALSDELLGAIRAGLGSAPPPALSAACLAASPAAAGVAPPWCAAAPAAFTTRDPRNCKIQVSS